ncbi:MAG: hypothetical protein AWU57_793 [Marinobacter sp. T13-3]|nr:MAG: hypothetical protein AWU57_793 [Marinobacter sp. T13-3]
MNFGKNKEIGSFLGEAPIINDKRIEAWCSWCGEYGFHTELIYRNMARSTYRCESCFQPTIQCRYCDSMARAANNDAFQNETKSKCSAFSDFFVRNWNNEFCSEHDGTTPDFTKIKTKIGDLSQFSDLMKPRKKNLYRLTKNAAIIGSGAVTLGAGSSLARFGLMPFLSSAIPISKTAYEISSAYFKDVPNFSFSQIRKPRNSSNHCTIVVNGWMSEEKFNSKTRLKVDAKDWLNGLPFSFDDIWHLNWESKSFLKIAGWIGSGATLSMPIGSITGIVSNPWHSSMINAQKTGFILAEAISRVEGKTFTLMGHSLGARVIAFALNALASKGIDSVADAVLLGGAVDKNDSEFWETAERAVAGHIYNCYSTRDDVLRKLYRIANLGLSNPIGQGKIVGPAINVDCSDIVGSHLQWKEKLLQVLPRLSII